MLLLCALASIALHLVMLAAIPVWKADPGLPEARVLDVVLVEAQSSRSPEPAGAAPSEPVLAPKPDVPAKPRMAKPPKRREKSAATEQKPEARRVPESDTSRLDAPARPEPQASANAEPGIADAPSPAKPESAARDAKTPGSSREEATQPAFAASYLRNPAPRYPLIARRNGEQGTVMLRVLVTREGMPARVTVEQTSGSRHLDSAALETVKTWRFVPARKGDEAIDAWVIVPIVFRLEGTS